MINCLRLNPTSKLLSPDNPASELTFIKKVEAGLVDDPFKTTNSHNFANYARFRCSINVLSILDEFRFDSLTFKEKIARNLVANPDSLLPEDEDIMLNFKEFEHLPILNISPKAAIISDSSLHIT